MKICANLVIMSFYIRVKGREMLHMLKRGKFKRIYSKCSKWICDVGSLVWIATLMFGSLSRYEEHNKERWAMPWRTSAKTMWKSTSMCLSVGTHWIWFIASINARVVRFRSPGIVCSSCCFPVSLAVCRNVPSRTLQPHVNLTVPER